MNAFANKIEKNYKVFVFDKYENEVRSGNVSDFASERFFYDINFEKLLAMKKTENLGCEISMKQEQFADKVDEQYLEYFFSKYVESILFQSVSRIRTTFLLANPKTLYEIKVFTDEQMEQIAIYLIMSG